MGCKQIGENLRFADLAVSKTLDQNRSLKMMEKINGSIDWENVEALLLEHYKVGKSKEGAYAFSPLLLMKCMLLQKWFRIPSDPELENQINDRISFRKFLGLTLDTPSPDHSTFSRFLKRVSKNAMIELIVHGFRNMGNILSIVSNSEIIAVAFHDQCLTSTRNGSTRERLVYIRNWVSMHVKFDSLPRHGGCGAP